MRFLKNLLENENLNEVVRGSLVSLLTKVTSIFLNYFLLFFISNKIGVAYVGFYNILLVFLFLTIILCSGGLNFAVIPLVNKYSKSKRELYKKSLRIIFLLLILAGLLFFLFSDNISYYLFSDVTTSVYGIIILMFLFVFTFFNIEFLRANKKITMSESLRNISFPFFIFIGVLSLDSFFIDKYLLVLFSIFMAILLTFIPSFFASLKVLKTTNLQKKNTLSYNKLFKISNPLLIMGLSSFFLSEASLFILKYYYTIKDVGNFTVIYKISILACLIFTIASTIIDPKISELFWKGKTNELRKTFRASFQLILGLSVPFFLLVLIFPVFFLNLFNLSKDFSLSLIIMLVGQFLHGVTAIFGHFLMVTDKQKIFRNVYIISALLNLTLGFYLIPKYAVLGASITVAISYIFLNLLCVLYVFKNKLIFN